MANPQSQLLFDGNECSKVSNAFDSNLGSLKVACNGWTNGGAGFCEIPPLSSDQSCCPPPTMGDSLAQTNHAHLSPPPSWCCPRALTSNRQQFIDNRDSIPFSPPESAFPLSCQLQPMHDGRFDSFPLRSSNLALPIEDDRRANQTIIQYLPPNFYPNPSFHPNYGGYCPDLGRYNLTQPPELFTGYSFSFDSISVQLPNNDFPPSSSSHFISTKSYPYLHPSDFIPNQQSFPIHFGPQMLVPNPQTADLVVSPLPLYRSPRDVALFFDTLGKTPNHPSGYHAVSTQRSRHLPNSGTRLSRRSNSLAAPSQMSSILENFRNKRDQPWDVKEIFGHVVEFSSDQHGSRFLQQKLEEASDEEKQSIFDEIVPRDVKRLIQDVFGNYVIQKFFDLGTESQKNILAKVVEDKVLDLSLQVYGCRVVQKAIENGSEKQQASYIRLLQQDILTCIKNAHGNHVIQKLIQVVNVERLTFIPLLCKHILELSTHPYGCRVLQRCLEWISSKHSRPLMDAIVFHAFELMQNQYGNYIMQYILERGQDLDKKALISQIRGNLIELSQQKYSSNVCEKALTFTDSTTRHILINEITADRASPILMMVKHQYANYVLQCALTVVEGEQRRLLYNQVKPLVLLVRNATTTYSRPLVSIERLVHKYFNADSEVATS